jgi:hypothetical protein
VRKKLLTLSIGIVMALLLLTILPVSAMAAQQPMSASGNVTYISGTVGFPAGNSGNFKVTSRTVSGTFTDGGDLTGDYSVTYKANVDLNTQAGDMSGQMTTDTQVFDLWGTSDPVQWTPSSDSPIGFIGTATASGTWKGHGWPGSGTFSAVYSFVPTLDGHIDQILPDSTFSWSGQWNLK